MGYDNIVSVIYDEIQNEFENNILKTIQSYHIYVNKEELIKALNYDRHQYEKGFRDGMRYMQQQQKEKHMRDEKRIDTFIQEIADIWHKYPDLRFSQLVLNVFRDPGDYYIEDSEALRKIKEVYNYDN